MTKEREAKMYANMDDVIETNKNMREYLLNDEISHEDKMDKFDFIQQALIANKTIVSASQVQLSIERLTKRTYEDDNAEK